MMLLSIGGVTCFLLHLGWLGKAVVQELARLFTAYREGDALECIAIKAAMVMCSLLLQRPHRANFFWNHFQLRIFLQ